MRPRKSGSFGSTVDQVDGSPVERRRSGVRLYVNEGPVKMVTLVSYTYVYVYVSSVVHVHSITSPCHTAKRQRQTK